MLVGSRLFGGAICNYFGACRQSLLAHSDFLIIFNSLKHMSTPEEKAQGSSVYENTNGMPMANGKNLHMEVGFGDIANRIITVGAVSRAEKIATFLDKDAPTKTITSHRGFTTITGEYKGVPVSIVAIGMGPSMMDFFVRESRAVTNGPMAIVR